MAKGLLAIIDILLILMFYGLIKKAMLFGGKAFTLEWIAIILLLILTLWGLSSAYSGKKSGWALLLIVFTLNLVNFLLMKFWIHQIKFWSMDFIVTLLGFLLTLMKSPEECSEEESDEPKVEPYHNGKEKVYTNFDQGKYLASSTGKKYHVPECDWAKKINPKKRVWFQSEDEITGLKPCDCVK